MRYWIRRILSEDVSLTEEMEGEDDRNGKQEMNEEPTLIL